MLNKCTAAVVSNKAMEKWDASPATMPTTIPNLQNAQLTTALDASVAISKTVAHYRKRNKVLLPR